MSRLNQTAQFVVIRDAVNVNAQNELGETPLHCAVLRNDLTQIIALLAGNADVDIADNDGNTPLHIAAQVGCVTKKKEIFPGIFLMFIIFVMFIS
ncbi:unnamed protein product [Gongylonema pulchrum]|uniref:ANK_REP_REGION domain-containing protein n=1 Tax=Gongylonema pulchrum TaxID=637853 RepID=A0A183D3J2_9BILA|nr:unnamed protein product [Gongylonema pulchrum]